MSFNYKNPLTPLSILGNLSVQRDDIFGTNFSILSTGGYMEVYSLNDLLYTIPPTTGLIKFSGNTIPIQLNKGNGSPFSFDVLTLNSDNISSGRRRIGMLVYVIEDNQIYQYQIPNFELLFSAATGATGIGGPTVVFSDFGTTIKSNSPEGINFISSWTANTIEGISGETSSTAVWRKLVTGGGVSGNYLPLSGGTVTGDTIFTSGLTANTFSASTYLGLPQDIFVTGGTYSAGTATFTNNTGGTFDVSGFYTGSTDIFVTGGTFDKNAETLTLNRNDGNNVVITGFTDVFVTGGTYSGGTLYLSDNSGHTFSVSGFYTGSTDIYVTGGTYSAGTATFTNNTGGTFNVDGFNKYFISESTPTGYTINNGDRWYNTNSGIELVYMSDGNSSQWVQPPNQPGPVQDISGPYLPLSGGTETGLVNFQNGLTTNVISGNTQGNIEIFPISGVSGNSLVVYGNILPGNGYNLGSPTNYFANAYVGPESLNILPENPLTGTTIVLKNREDILGVTAGGFAVYDPTESYYTFQTDKDGRSFFVSPIASGEAVVSIQGATGNTYPFTAPLGGSLIHATAANGAIGFFDIDSFSNTAVAGGAGYVGRRFRGTPNTPLAVQAGDYLLNLIGAGFNGTNVRSGVGSARILFIAQENFNSTSQAAFTQFRNQVPVTGVEVVSAIINSSGLTIPSVASGGTGNAGIKFTDNSFQTTAYLGTATTSKIGGVKPDGTTITITTGGTISAVSTPTFVGGSWGSFISLVDQTNGVAGNTYKMSASTTTGSSGVTVSGGSRFVVSNPGVYNIQFSAQLSKTTGNKTRVFIWLSKDGTPVTNSSTEVTLDGGANDRELAAWNWVDHATSSNTYYEIEWTDSYGNAFLDYDGSPLYGPAIPSIIVTLTQV